VKKDDSFKDFIVDQLSGLEGVTARAMFGGHGLYRGGMFFGIIHKGRLYFKTNDSTRSVYLECGMKAFRPNPGQTLKNYLEVPADILEEPERLTAWAQQAIGSVLSA
jgi:DNA transformation protein